MSEQSDNDALTQGDEQFGEVSSDFVPEDAWPVCPKCFKPCNPLQNYCDNCDSNETINPLASYMPFVRIRFTAGMFGKIWRRIWNSKDTSIISKLFFLILIIFGAPIMLIVGCPLFLIGKIKDPQLQKTISIAFYILLLVLFITYLFYVLVSH